MKALVLSGGLGTRLRPFTHSMAKQLVPVANKPVLRHCLDNIRDIGIVDVGVVVGARADEIVAELGDGAGLGMRITYIHQEEPLGLAHCVLIAADFLRDSDLGPSTSVGPDCVVTGSRVTESMLLEGAHVAGVLELRESVVGRWAHVAGAGAGAGATVVIGDHARAEVAA